MGSAEQYSCTISLLGSVGEPNIGINNEFLDNKKYIEVMVGTARNLPDLADTQVLIASLMFIGCL